MSHSHLISVVKSAPPIWATLTRYQISPWLNFVPLGYTIQSRWHNNSTAAVKKCSANKAVACLTGLLLNWGNADSKINTTFFYMENKYLLLRAIRCCSKFNNLIVAGDGAKTWYNTKSFIIRGLICWNFLSGCTTNISLKKCNITLKSS